ncbi:MAG: UPF0175 family protein [Candidatus Thermoplasmatota archaeon]
MGDLISVRVHKDLQEELDSLSKAEDKDKSVLIRELLLRGLREKKIERAVKLYHQGKVTLWKAARTADLSLWAMIEILKERRVEIQYGAEELKEDLVGLEGPQ